MKKYKFLLLAAFVGMIVSCGSKSSGKPDFSDNEYSVVTANGQSTSLETTYPATIKGVQDVEIRPKVQGFITKICVTEGQSVRKGQLLFVLDNVTYEAAVRQAKAAVNSAQAQLSTAKLTYQNNEKLFNNNVIGSYELQSAKNSYEAAQAALLQAKASYTSAKQNLDFCYVTSPANGVVGTLPYKVGALVSAQSQMALTTVSDISTMQVYFSVTEKEIMEMSRNDGGVTKAINNFPPVKLKLADGTMYSHDGKVVTISGVIDQTTGSVQMKAEFSNPERLLKSGGAGSIVVASEHSNAIIVPQEAVVKLQDKYFIYILGAGNKVKYTEISVLDNNNGKTYVVVGGMKIGDRYVSQGTTTLSDGMEIRPITPEQYAAKIKKMQELGAAQGDGKKLKEALSK